MKAKSHALNLMDEEQIVFSNTVLNYGTKDSNISTLLNFDTCISMPW